DCRVVAVYPGGDHSIFLGQVEALGASEQPPLLYYRGTYTHLDRE
ncbi:MAG: flavin reductase family protein, partial [Ktedonobacterales bacterium]|nr:flavin reductase family protein [Ktedonobacterales bacterium]